MRSASRRFNEIEKNVAAVARPAADAMAVRPAVAVVVAVVCRDDRTCTRVGEKYAHKHFVGYRPEC